MIFRATVTAFFSIIGLPAAALCSGDGFLEGLEPQAAARLQASAEATPYGNGLIWDATKGNKNIHLIGTMHVYDPQLEPIRTAVKDKVTNADLLLVEATAKEEKQLQDLITTQPDILFITDGPTLPDRLDEETWEMIAEAASARSVPGFLAAKMQPWYLSMLLSVPPCAMQGIATGDRGLDHMIMQDATEAGVSMQAVEPYNTLFEIFQSDSVDDQLDMLRANLMAPEEQEKVFVSMFDRYFEGDIATLWEMSKIAIGDDQEAEAIFEEATEALLTGRNRNWMPIIFDAADTHDNLVVAVGAAHLIGEEGLLQFLADDGWTIERVQ